MPGSDQLYFIVTQKVWHVKIRKFLFAAPKLNSTARRNGQIRKFSAWAWYMEIYMNLICSGTRSCVAYSSLISTQLSYC
jgi:hypothetical protein